MNKPRRYPLTVYLNADDITFIRDRVREDRRLRSISSLVGVWIENEIDKLRSSKVVGKDAGKK